MKIKRILLGSILLSVSLFACNCNDAVVTNYDRIKAKIVEHFEPVEAKLDDTITELDATIEAKEKEIELMKKTLESKQALLLQHSNEISQLEQMQEYVKNQNDVKGLSAKTELQKNQNATIDNMLDVQKNSNEPFWK